MMLENCCYGRRELAVLNLVKQGLFGETVHATGGYMHYLNDVELFKDIEDDNVKHYRLDYYINNNRESYPTHELGPIAKALNINRGNRMVRLNCITSKSCGLKSYAKEKLGEGSKYSKIDYKQANVVTTLITCANGETIQLTLDTTLPRGHYSRNFSIRGTKGMSNEDILKVALTGIEYDIFDELEADYLCNCSRERTEKALISLGKSEAYKILDEQRGEGRDCIELSCHFCDKTYKFYKNDIDKLFK
jgi:hypothetical protein